MSTIDEIMSDVQSFASTWALVGGRFDHGGMYSTAKEQSADLREMITAALAEARREGAEAMRAEANSKLQALRPVAWVRYGSDGRIDGPLLDAQVDGARRECWTPLVAADFADRDRRQAVRLTDEQIAQALHATTGDAADGVDFKAWALHPYGREFVELSRAVESAVLAANGLGDAK